MSTVLMPKATAVWLVDNTALTFEQIAEFCGLHVLEVKGIADGDVAQGIRGADPIASGQLSRDEIEKAEKDADYRMKVHVSRHAKLQKTERKGARYTPVSRRQDRPDAIFWMVRNHPEVTDAQIGRLLGTTKTTIQAVREGNHWNSQNIKAVDPVALGLCKQIELDAVVKKAQAKKEKMIAEATAKVDEGPTMATTAAQFSAGVVMDDMGDVGPMGDVSADDVFDDQPDFSAMDDMQDMDDIDPDKVFGTASTDENSDGASADKDTAE